MIISKAPLRVSFVGGGSDLRSFYSHFGGAVLSTSIDKYIYVTTHPSSEKGVYTVKHSETERAQTVEEIQHPIVRECLKKLQMDGGLDISSTSDVPPGTGMGSSSTFTTALLENLYARKGLSLSRAELAELASHMEIDILGEPIGKQDQYASAFGGLNIIRFNRDDSVEVQPVVPSDSKRLEDNLLMFYTATRRRASSILSEQKANMSRQSKQDILKEMVSYVDVMADLMEKGNYEEFGKILHKNWELKQQLASGISSDSINDIYNRALSAGACGGKLLGAGGGGFLLFYCEKERQDKLRTALKDLREFPFGFDNKGSHILCSDEHTIEGRS